MKNEISTGAEERGTKENREYFIEVLQDIIACRGAESARHIRCVQRYTRVLAEQFAKLYPRSRMTKGKIEWIVQAAGLHDIGKLALPDCLLSRPGRLSRYEMGLLKEHTVTGSRLIRKMSAGGTDDFARICYNVCLYHHEKYDGSGYPCGLKKEKIPIEAQIVGLADMYDILVNESAGGEGYSKEQAFYMLMNGVCGELSPRMKECLSEAKGAMEAIHIGEEKRLGTRL